ncbi:hypothetical protein [Lacticaseibacillus paracasei]|uniref:hypothetical protein n=1 Tax=Lacticaseibacillus paracasei TaxID=1597 RepID=UPI0021A2C0EB|nr:hypothetical protein [Lacticaseibacillus paracasei]MCT2893705.1 hypothetical protein [Lacticaseibacillus paracasei]
MSDITLLNKGQSDWQNVVNQNFQNLNGDIIPFSDTGWLTDGLTLGANVASADLRYRIVTLGSRKTFTLYGSFTLNNAILAASWGTSGRLLFSFPNSVSKEALQTQRFITTDSNNARQNFVFRDLVINNQYGVYFDNYVVPGDTNTNYPSTFTQIASIHFDVA